MPRNQPYMVTLEPGTHYWCSCGKSGQEPFCDGSHENTGKEPVAFEIKAASKKRLSAAVAGQRNRRSVTEHMRADDIWL